MHSTRSPTASIPLLTDDNYNTWSYLLTAYLRSKGLGQHILDGPEEVTYPSSITTQLTTTTDVDDDDKLPDKPARGTISSHAIDPKWLTDDMKALAFIQMHVSERFYEFIEKAKTALEAWNTIHNEWKDRFTGLRLTLRRQYSDAKMLDKELSTLSESSLST